jgi:zinc D-Ala-D-Ala carboxypeptidase
MIDLLLGKFNPAQEATFDEVPLATADEPNHYLQSEVLDAWLEMHAAAKQHKIELQIISSTRNFERQKTIWENKWNGITLTQGRNLATENLSDAEKAKAILKYSAMPCTSRHHWGTDFDINSVEDAYFETTKGQEEYHWLQQNAAKFGFAQPYTVKSPERPNGYKEEKWHWSYTPLSINLLDVYLEIIQYQDIKGFQGATYAQELEVITNYVFGVAGSCKPAMV